jgi:hypothetical protein
MVVGLMIGCLYHLISLHKIGYDINTSFIFKILLHILCAVFICILMYLISTTIGNALVYILGIVYIFFIALIIDQAHLHVFLFFLLLNIFIIYSGITCLLFTNAP